jgi:hypothetical protein
MQNNKNIFENYGYYKVWSISQGDAEFNKNKHKQQTTVKEDSS